MRPAREGGLSQKREQRYHDGKSIGLLRVKVLDGEMKEDA